MINKNFNFQKMITIIIEKDYYRSPAFYTTHSMSALACFFLRGAVLIKKEKKNLKEYE